MYKRALSKEVWETAEVRKAGSGIAPLEAKLSQLHKTQSQLLETELRSLRNQAEDNQLSMLSKIKDINPQELCRC
jgi:hypothetical protein